MCEEVHLNLAYRWFCRLGLEDEVPNHSTFSKNRHGRFRDSDLFRWLFNEVLRRCMAAGLVKGEGFAVDASIIKADASRQRGVAGDEVDWNDPKLSSRAVREYLEALDEEALAEALPKKISLTDPQSRWTAAPGGPAFFAYSTNYLIDTEHGVIMDVEATPAHRTAEVDSTRTMVERVEAQFDLTPERLIGDTAYGTAPMLAWMVEEKDIEPHVPVWDKTERKDDSLSSNDFHWSQDANEYRCPAGKPLRSEWRAFTQQRSRVTKAKTVTTTLASIYQPLYGNERNISEHYMENRWSPYNTSGHYPRLTTQSNANNFAPSSLWTECGDFLKLRTLSLSYKLPARLASKIRMRECCLYLKGMNLFSADRIDILDPEYINTGYPSARSYQIGFNLIF